MENILRNRSELKGKKILVVGMGKSGESAAKVLHEIGSRVSVQDSSVRENLNPRILSYIKNEEIPAYLGCLPPDISTYDMVLVSPGVSLELEIIKEAKKFGVEVIGEVELAYRLSYGKYIGITGTNGKTTTTTLVGEIFKNAKRDTKVVGNIGNPAISEALGSKNNDWFILEISSFQLETVDRFKPVVSAILNLTPDHLNRHHTMEAYAAAKARIFENQSDSDYLIINKDDDITFNLAKDARAKIIPFSRKEELDIGAYVKEDMLKIKDEDGLIHEICKISEIKIPGNHNIENILAASAISYFAGIDSSIIRETVINFYGVEHRIEYIGKVDGIKFYNDSKGTNVDATITALKALDKDIVLIAGGDGKGQDFSKLANALGNRVKAALIFGRDRENIGKAFKNADFNSFIYKDNLPECVKEAMIIAKHGDKILLSPACASWDMYDNYMQRGEHFKECVNSLLK